MDITCAQADKCGTVRPVTCPNLHTARFIGLSYSSVFLTKNGDGRYAILDMEDYDRLVNERTLFSKLERGLMSGESEGWGLVLIRTRSF